MPWPKYVYAQRAGAKTYYYFQFGRGTAKEGPRVSLPAPDDPKFLRAVAAAQRKHLPAAAQKPASSRKSVAWLIGLYRESEDFASLSKRSRDVYDVHLRRMESDDVWGKVAARSLVTFAVTQARDALKDTPGMANQMISIGRILYDWAAPLAHLGDQPFNPFDKVPNLDVDGDRGHIPWPRFLLEFADQHAWSDIRRMIRLGVATCQRESDMVRLGPEQRDGPGLWCRPRKTRKKRKSFRIPLAAADTLEFDRWAETPLVFTNKRRLKPFEQFRADLYLYSPRGASYSETSLRARWGRWLKTPKGKEFCDLWREWLDRMVKKFEWDIDRDERKSPTIHGLRGTGFLKRLAAGYAKDQIANDCGAHPNTVQHYMRFRDQVEIADANRRLVVLQGLRA